MICPKCGYITGKLVPVTNPVTNDEIEKILDGDVFKEADSTLKKMEG